MKRGDIVRLVNAEHNGGCYGQLGIVAGDVGVITACRYDWRYVSVWFLRVGHEVGGMSQERYEIVDAADA